ncbi:MAG: ATP phosphoribosyltransferase regulatory subunit [Brevinematia bacterium]
MKEFLKSVFLAKKDLVGAPSGFSFEFNEKRRLVEPLYKIVETRGFVEVSTPTFDFFEVYEKTLGSGAKELFVFKDGSDFIVPRYDITTQIVRFLAPRVKSLKFPVKVFYYGDVFREPEFRWYPRQIGQFGVEIIGGGDNDLRELLEVLKEMLSVFVSLKVFNEYKFVFNFSQVLDSVFSKFPLDERELVRYLLSNKDLPSLRNMAGEEVFRLIERFVDLSFEEKVEVVVDEVFDILGMEVLGIKLGVGMVNEIFGDTIFDPTLVPDIDYYSGIFFKVYVDTLPYSIAGGGRYDSLTERFGYKATAMGFAIDVV